MTRSVVVRLREYARVGVAFARLDAVEEFAYPLGVAFRYLAIAVPIVVQFFVSRLVPQTGSIGSDYFTFAVVGVTVANALTAAIDQTSKRIERLQNQGTLESLLVEPASWVFVPVALSLWPLANAVLAVVVGLGFGAALGMELDLGGLGPFALVLLVGMAAANAIGVLAAAGLAIAKRSSPFIRLYGIAATLLGGAVFPLSLLPDWLRGLSVVVPHSYAISAGRQALMAEPPTTPPVAPDTAVVALGAFALLAYPLSLWAFSRALSYARRHGILASY